MAVCVATFMLLLDITVVNVALPYIERDLEASFEDLQWVIDAYALTLAAFLLTAGSIADDVGRRRVFVAGLVVFTVASALCGLAGSPLMLNLARGLQGVGGGMMFATALALLASAYQGRDRGTAIGLWGATTGAAVAIGPLVGGVLVEAIGWEAIFFVNLPIGIAAIALTLTRVQESRDPHGERARLGRHDHVLGRAVPGRVRAHPRQRRGLERAPSSPAWPAPPCCWSSSCSSSGASRQPILDLSLFRKPAFCGASIAAFVLSASMFAMFLYLTLYVQNILGYARARGRPALPADHAGVVRDRADLRQARRARRRALVPGRRAWRSSASGCC